jgi:hypothetical protein
LSTRENCEPTDTDREFDPLDELLELELELLLASVLTLLELPKELLDIVDVVLLPFELELELLELELEELESELVLSDTDEVVAVKDELFVPGPLRPSTFVGSRGGAVDPVLVPEGFLLPDASGVRPFVPFPEPSLPVAFECFLPSLALLEVATFLLELPSGGVESYNSSSG